jgi:hypothetical protein
VARPTKLARSRAILDKRARSLKGAGVALSYKLGRKNSPQAAAWVTRRWKNYRTYLNPKKGTVPSKFVRLDKEELKIARTFYSPSAITKGGLFVQLPRGVKAADYKVTVNKKTRRIEIRSPRKKVFDEIIALETKGFLRDPEAALKATLKGTKNIRQVKIMVNGFQSKNTYSVKGMAFYLRHVLIPDLRDEFEESDHRLTAKAIADIFQIKVIHGSKRTKKKHR